MRVFVTGPGERTPPASPDYNYLWPLIMRWLHTRFDGRIDIPVSQVHDGSAV